MAIVLQLSAYKWTFQSFGVGQLLRNLPLSQNRWICYGSDYSSAELRCNLVASYTVWGTGKHQRSPRDSKKKKTVLRLNPASESHTQLHAWDFPLLVLMLLPRRQMWRDVERSGWLRLFFFCHSYTMYSYSESQNRIFLFHIEKSAKGAVLIFHLGFSFLSLQLWL